MNNKLDCKNQKTVVYLYRMSNKNYRLQLIKELINGERIESQENLAERLKDKGLTLTQATLSRDLKLLNAAKVADDSGYRYVIGERVRSTAHQKECLREIAGALVSLDFAGNMGVIKTKIGYAGSAALAVDKLNIPDILGTIAGDDTVFFVMRDESRKDAILAYLSGKIPEKENK